MNDHKPLSAKTVLSRISERCTFMQRPEEFMRKPGVFEIDEKKTGDVRLDTSDRNEEYELRLTIGCRYWANTVQHQSARRNAESILARLLYEDVIRSIHEIRHAAFDGDKIAVLRRLAELEESISR